MSKDRRYISPSTRMRILELRQSIRAKRNEQEELTIRLAQTLRTLNKNSSTTRASDKKFIKLNQ